MVITDEQRSEIESLIHDYIKKNLNVKVVSESSCFWTTDGSPQTRTLINIYLGDELITGDWN